MFSLKTPTGVRRPSDTMVDGVVGGKGERTAGRADGRSAMRTYGRSDAIMHRGTDGSLEQHEGHDKDAGPSLSRWSRGLD